MKKLALTIMSLTIALFSLAQSVAKNQLVTQASINYDEVIKFDIQIDNMTAEMQAMLPKENTSAKQLHFNEKVSRYENRDNSEDTYMEDESKNGGVSIMISQADNIVYRDLENSKMLEQTEFMTRVFLIESDMPKEEWKITAKQKEILGFLCQQAIKQTSDSSWVNAWFTPMIPVSSGPGEYGNLPGLILAVETSDGDRSITATSIDIKTVDKKLLQKPKKGKKVSREEFETIVAEKTEEMGGASGGQTIIMRIGN